jgi:protein O-mannosyl-transferase
MIIMKTWQVITGIVLFGAVLYAPNIHNPLFWDDADWILDNSVVHEVSWKNIQFIGSHDVLAGINGRSNYYRPVLMLSFMTNWALHSSSPWGYHLVSNGLHIANAVLVFLLLAAFLDRRIAASVAILWLIHPLHTEAVAYVSGRGDPLSLFFMLSAMVLWLRSDRWRMVALACAVFALLSRETGILLPAYVVIVLMTFVYRADSFWVAFRRSCKSALPFILISALYGLLRLTIFDFQNTLNWYSHATVYSENIEVRIWTFLQVLWVYVRLAILPIGLHMERTVPVLFTPWHWSVGAGVGFLVAACTASVHAWRRGNRIVFFSTALFLIPLAPSSGIFAPINALAYEHWLYVSLIGFTTAIGYYGVRIGEWLWSHARVLGYTYLMGCTLYVVGLSVQTMRRNSIWGDRERFYLNILQHVPYNVRALNNLANFYAMQGNQEENERYLRKATEADPTQPAPYYNLANLMRDRKRLPEAVDLYLQAIEVDPLFHHAYRNLASLLLEHGNVSGALRVITTLQELMPQDIQIRAVYEELKHLNNAD